MCRLGEGRGTAWWANEWQGLEQNKARAARLRAERAALPWRRRLLLERPWVRIAPKAVVAAQMTDAVGMRSCTLRCHICIDTYAHAATRPTYTAQPCRQRSCTRLPPTRSCGVCGVTGAFMVMHSICSEPIPRACTCQSCAKRVSRRCRYSSANVDAVQALARWAAAAVAGRACCL